MAYRDQPAIYDQATLFSACKKAHSY